MNQRELLWKLYGLRKDEYTVIRGSPVFCTGNTIILIIHGVEMEYEYFGDAARSIISEKHETPIFGYAKEL